MMTQWPKVEKTVQPARSPLLLSINGQPHQHKMACSLIDQDGETATFKLLPSEKMGKNCNFNFDVSFLGWFIFRMCNFNGKSKNILSTC